MTPKNFFKFISNPKSYINQLVELNANKEIDIIAKNQFLTPIDQVSDEDIFIVGFPKSGNTWMQSLISGIVYGTHTEFMSDQLAQEIVPDVHARTHYKRLGNVNFFKSHHLPQPNYRKVIYLIRDGRDAMVSYYHYNQNRGLEVTLEEMIMNGLHIMPSKWYEHVQLWQENPYDAEIITIKYEDLLSNPLRELKRLCHFINIDRANDLLQKVISLNHINNMRERVSQNNGMANKSFTGSKGVKFFRRGSTGDYRKEMSPKLEVYFRNESLKQLSDFDYL